MIQIIPAIDIIEGRCVRLIQGDYSRKSVYGNDPVDIAKAFENAGVRRLHLIDLDGARAGSIQNLRVLERIASSTELVIDFGGGIKDREDVLMVFEAGASMAAVGSAPVLQRDDFLSWLDEFGGGRFLMGADVRGSRIAVDGWQTDTDIEIIPFLQEMRKHGVERAFVTDISKDGLLEGSAVGLYEEILAELHGFELIASGGVSCVEDVERLAKAGVSGVIIGKAIYEGLVDAGELVRLSGTFGRES